MTGNPTIIYCYECRHCFNSRRSVTGYACEKWGHEDFACPTILGGFCHQAKPRTEYSGPKVSIEELRKLKGE